MAAAKKKVSEWREEEGGVVAKKRKKAAAATEEEEEDEGSSEEEEEEAAAASDDSSSSGSDSGSSSDSNSDSSSSGIEEEESAAEESEPEPESESDESESEGKKKKKKSKGGKRSAKGGDADAESVGSFDAYQRVWTAEDDGDDELEPEEMEERLANKYRRVQEVRGRSIVHMHPELTAVSHEEMLALSRVVRNERGEVADPLHRRSAALLSKYEFTAVTSKRAEQLERDDDPLVQDLPPGMVSSIAIAHYEFQKGALNDIFIIQRPFPDGTSEYWRLGDLEHV